MPELRQGLRQALRLTAATVLTGLGAGVGGIVVVLLLQTLQHAAFGYGHGTFALGVAAAAPWRRVLALAIAGVVGGVGWWALRRYAAPVAPIRKAVAGERMPFLATVTNVALQIGIVGLGASIGREAGPRELGALLADRFSRLFRLTPRERRILVAAGAGAGLAAVYDVPFGGALFAIEILLAEFSVATALPAFATAAIAAFVARVVVPEGPLYVLPHLGPGTPLMIWAVPVGLVTGALAAGFVRLITRLTSVRPRGRAILWIMPVAFLFVGVLSIALPEVLGNGRAAAQTILDGAALPLLILLLLGKAAAVGATIGAGAEGGTLTPSIALGAASGAIVGSLAALLTPGAAPAGYAFLGAGAFLAVTMRGPFTAAVLVLEFSGASPGMLIPAMLAIAAAVGVGHLIERVRLAPEAA